MEHVTELELIEYAAGTIARSQVAAIEEHLAQCDSCRQMCEQTKLVHDSLGDFTAPQVGDITVKVRQGINVQTIFGWQRLAYNFARVAAAIVIAALAGYFAAAKSAPAGQPDSLSVLKSQSDISFAQPAQHIAMAVSGEIK